MPLPPSKLKLQQRACYRICVQGTLDASWADYFADLAIIGPPAAGPIPVTVLTGQVTDQAMLLGVLNGLYGLGLCLVLVECLVDAGDAPEGHDARLLLPPPPHQGEP